MKQRETFQILASIFKAWHPFHQSLASIIQEGRHPSSRGEIGAPELGFFGCEMQKLNVKNICLILGKLNMLICSCFDVDEIW